MLLHNKYQIQKTLGKGGMGEVYKAVDTQTNQEVAIKKLLETEQMHKQRFSREYQLLKAINYPHIVKVFDFFEEKGHLHMAMELIAGESMKELLQEAKNEFSMLEKLAVAHKVASAIELLNLSKILHRDIKPDNIMINVQTGDVKILDLGIGKDLGGAYNTMTLSQSVLGTISYLSPEQADGNFSEQSDIFSLGVTLHQFFLWQQCSPFYDPNSMTVLMKIAEENPPDLYQEICHRYQQVNRKITDKEKMAYKKLSRVLMKAMAKDPSKRWQSVEILVDTFAKLHQEFLQMKYHSKSICYPNLISLATKISPRVLNELEALRREIKLPQQEKSSQKKIKRQGKKRYSKRDKKASNTFLQQHGTKILFFICASIVVFIAHFSHLAPRT